jgi:hypothetical protein
MYEIIVANPRIVPIHSFYALENPMEGHAGVNSCHGVEVVVMILVDGDGY